MSLRRHCDSEGNYQPMSFDSFQTIENLISSALDSQSKSSLPGELRRLDALITLLGHLTIQTAELNVHLDALRSILLKFPT